MNTYIYIYMHKSLKPTPLTHTCRDQIAVATSNGSINFWDYKAGGRPKAPTYSS